MPKLDPDAVAPARLCMAQVDLQAVKSRIVDQGEQSHSGFGTWPPASLFMAWPTMPSGPAVAGVVVLPEVYDGRVAVQPAASRCS